MHNAVEIPTTIAVIPTTAPTIAPISSGLERWLGLPAVLLGAFPVGLALGVPFVPVPAEVDTVVVDWLGGGWCPKIERARAGRAV
jgi:hypothetical protein